MIRFSQIPDKLHYPPSVKAQLSTLHSDIITYVASHFHNSFKYRSKVVAVMNSISYVICNQDSLPDSWIASDPIDTMSIVDEEIVRKYLVKLPNGSLFLSDKNIEWDVEETETSQPEPSISQSEFNKNVDKAADAILETTKQFKSDPEESKQVAQVLLSGTPFTSLSDKSDLYIQPPAVPLFDINKVWFSNVLDGTSYSIYSSLPEIPRKQNQISCTTNVNRMTDADLVALYPDKFIRTRSSCMYDNYEGLKTDPLLGLILPISGYTEEQVLRNIIEYPHIFRLQKKVDGQVVSFYSTIEIGGELKDVLDWWGSDKDTSKLPKTPEFIKEYVVRRYLLERDVSGVSHKYPLFGSLDPFLTLFAPRDQYIQFGYKDVVELARKCVIARVAYKQTRNPILRKAGVVGV